jgi:hypothetical protein
MSSTTSTTISDLTPYAAFKVTNLVLAAEGLDKVITPQMLYSYAQKELIATVPGSKPILFEGEAFKEWLDKYVSRVRNGDANARVDYEALAEQFMADEDPEDEDEDEDEQDETETDDNEQADDETDENE